MEHQPTLRSPTLDAAPKRPNQGSNDNARPAPSTPQSRSCHECHRRKIKCDKKLPCSYCTKVGVSCAFPQLNQGSKRRASFSESDILERLKRLERAVEQNGTSSQSMSPPPVVTRPVDEHVIERNGQTHQDVPPDERTMLSRASNEQPVISRTASRASMHDNNEDISHRITANAISAGRSGFLFKFHSLTSNIEALHPSPDKISSLWQVYLENVDPFLKLIHTPTVQKEMLKIGCKSSPSLGLGMHAMAFAIYYAAVNSLCPSTCLEDFGIEKEALLDRYRFGVEQALSRANILSTKDVTVLQAFVLFLTCVRRDPERSGVWTLLSLAVRIATKMGLQHDGSSTGLPPFEAEMRRRLWWHILALDVRTAEDANTDPIILETHFDAGLPTNVNDSDLDPNMREVPAERASRTEMIFTLVRFKIMQAMRKLLFSQDFSKMNGYPVHPKEGNLILLTDLGKMLEMNYLMHCDTDIPIFYVTASIARLMLSKLRVMVELEVSRLNASAPSPFGTNTQLLSHFTSIIASTHALLTMKTSGRWIWLFQLSIEWYAIDYILHALVRDPVGLVSEKAWNAVDTAWAGYRQIAKEGNLDDRWRRMEYLRAEAADARELCLQLGCSSNHQHEINWERLNYYERDRGAADEGMFAFWL